MDRDVNAALNTLSRGFEKRGLGQSEDATPVMMRSVCSLSPVSHVDVKNARERTSHGLSDAV
jgi:hypothetical protein